MHSQSCGDSSPRRSRTCNISESASIEETGSGKTAVADLKPSGIYRGWPVAATTFLTIGISIGAAQFAFGAFIIPLEEEFGWSRTEINVSLTLAASMGIITPFVGRLMDKHGARSIMAASVSLMIAGFLLRSVMTELWQFYTFSMLIFLGTPGSSMLPVGRLVTLWFSTTRGRMMGLVMSGVNSGGLMYVPLLTAVIAFAGWRWGFASIGFLLSGILILIMFVIRDKREDVESEVNKRWMPRGDAGEAARAASEGFTAREAIRTRAFWFLSFGMALQHFAQTSAATQFFPHLEQGGFTSAQAAIGLMILALFAIASKIIFGTISEWITARWSYVIVVALQITGLAILLLPGSQMFIWGGLMVFGLGMGGVGALGPLAIAEMFGLKNFGAIIGLTTPALIIPTLVGPVMAGFIFDSTGSYVLAFQITLGVLLISMTSFAMASPPFPFKRSSWAVG